MHSLLDANGPAYMLEEVFKGVCGYNYYPRGQVSQVLPPRRQPDVYSL
jgi:hypothetical protein